jgi:hypothetical protein
MAAATQAAAMLAEAIASLKGKRKADTSAYRI